LPALTNAKHERFAQELAKGRTQAEAYEAAGYAPSEPNASRLTSNDKVAKRVAEIQERAAVRAEITIAGLTESLMRLASKAEALQDASGFQASRASLMDAAKLNGLVVDKTDQTLSVAVKEIRRTVVDPQHPDA
jgi:phage terminase small subunit